MTEALNQQVTDPLQRNRQARAQALSRVSPALNLAAPAVSFESAGRLLIMGPEHRIRLAAAQLDAVADKVGLVTEAMPSQVTEEMMTAAELACDLKLYRLPLVGLNGYLGRFAVEVRLDEQPAPLAKIAFGGEYFDTVLDLSAEPLLAMALKPAGYFAPADQAALDAAMETLPTLKGGFEKPRYFQINTDLCAHSGSDMTGCTRCLDLCPADAIRSIEGLINIDSHLCHGAGGCATACPTSAIRYGYPQPRQLLDSLQGLLGQYAEVGGVAPCLLLHDAEQGREQVEASLDSLAGQWLPLQIEEMGSAGLEVWLSAIALGVVEVALLTGDQVPESILATLQSETGLANTLLEGLGLESKVRLVADIAELEGAVKAAPVQAIAAVDVDASKRQQISQAMDYLQSQSAAGHDLVKLRAGAPFGAVLIDEKDCTLCMSCSAICPSQALTSAGDTPRLSFVEDNCVQCGLCTQACPENALQLQPRYLLDGERRATAQVLKQEEPFCCIRCSKPFATQSVISLMVEKLTGHSMFDESGLNRLKMCADCRVVDMVLTDPGGDLFEYAKGRSADEGEINLAQVEAKATEEMH